MEYDGDDTGEGGLRLSRAERRFGAVALIAIAILHVAFPGLPIDGTLLVLLGGAALLWKFEIDSIEIGGIKARSLARQLEADEERIHRLPPAEKVAVPNPPTGIVEVAEEGWFDRASAAVGDLEVPREAAEQILWAAEQIRIELTVLAGNSGHLEKQVAWSTLTVRYLSDLLVTHGLLRSEIADAILRFVEIRNRFAHGSRLPLDVIESTSEVGLGLVATLRSRPRDWVRVVKSGIRVWADRHRTLATSTGVMLVQLDPSGVILARGVYPSGESYATGSFVTWEWDPSRPIKEEGWYEDPFDGKMQMAWSNALYFKGRPYPESWGLMYRFPRPDVGLPD